MGEARAGGFGEGGDVGADGRARVGECGAKLGRVKGAWNGKAL